MTENRGCGTLMGRSQTACGKACHCAGARRPAEGSGPYLALPLGELSAQPTERVRRGVGSALPEPDSHQQPFSTNRLSSSEGSSWKKPGASAISAPNADGQSWPGAAPFPWRRRPPISSAPAASLTCSSRPTAPASACGCPAACAAKRTRPSAAPMRCCGAGASAWPAPKPGRSAAMWARRTRCPPRWSSWPSGPPRRRRRTRRPSPTTSSCMRCCQS